MLCKSSDGAVIDLKCLDTPSVVRELLDVHDDQFTPTVPFTERQLSISNAVVNAGFEQTLLKDIFDCIAVFDFCNPYMYDACIRHLISTRLDDLDEDHLFFLLSQPRLPSGTEHDLLRAAYVQSSTLDEFLQYVRYLTPKVSNVMEYIRILSCFIPTGIACQVLIETQPPYMQTRFFTEILDNIDELLRSNIVTIYDLEALGCFAISGGELEPLKILAKTLSVKFSYIHKECIGHDRGVIQISKHKDVYRFSTPFGTLKMNFDNECGVLACDVSSLKKPFGMVCVVSEFDIVVLSRADTSRQKFHVPIEFLPNFIYMFEI